MVGTEKVPVLKRLVLMYLGSSSMVSASHLLRKNHSPSARGKNTKCKMLPIGESRQRVWGVHCVFYVNLKFFKIKS